jgi:hypothetical protein
MGLQPEKLPKEDPARINPHKRFKEVDKDKDAEDSIRIEIDVLDVVVPQHPLEKIACGECESVLHEPREHRDLVGFFSIR